MQKQQQKYQKQHDCVEDSERMTSEYVAEDDEGGEVVSDLQQF